MHAQSQDGAVTEEEAKAAAAASASDESAEAGAIVVTGSRIKRSQAEGPAPITIISTEQMRKNGFSTVYDALLTATEATGAIQADSTWGQSSVNASPLNLRNLGPGRTLLLINGHRVADYPMPYQGRSNFANYNNLPSGIINRTEILSGAASAIYGSDAMGGVVNIVLNEKAEGQTARIRYGGATRGGRRNVEANLSGGFSGDNWNVLYNLQHQNRGTLLAKDRPFMDDEADAMYEVWGPAERYFGVGRTTPYPGLYMRRMDVNPTMNIAPPAGTCQAYGDIFFDAEKVNYNRNTGVASREGTYCGMRVFSDWALRTGSKDNSGYLHGNMDLGDVTLWASTGLWHTKGGFNTFLPAFYSQHYWDPRANGGRGEERRFRKILTPDELGGKKGVMTNSDELAFDMSAGLKGKAFGEKFDWEVMYGHSTYTIDETFPTLNRGDMFDYYMGARQGTAVRNLPIYTPDYNRLWNKTPSSDIAKFQDRGLKKAKSWLDQAQAVISGDLFEGWAGPIGVAGVVEWGRQGYQLTPEPKTLVADPDGWTTPFGNIEQGGGTRSRYAAGMELSVPLTEWATLSLAGRWDKYEAVASDAAFTYQTGLEIRPTNNLLLRGSYGTSFRAPDMHFVYAEPSKGIADFTDYSACYKAGHPNRQCRRDDFLIDDAIVARQGTPDLLYEKGDSFTVGAVWDAFRGFSASVDYWRINVSNLIDDVDANQVLVDEGWCRYGLMPDGVVRDPPLSTAMCALQTSRVHRNAAGVVTQIDTGPINRASTRIAGIDAKLNYQLADTGFGRFALNASYSLLVDYRSRQFPTEEFVNTVSQQRPRYRFNAGVNWSYEDRVNASIYMYQKAGGRNNRWSGCAPFEDGFVPSPGNNCLDNNPASPTFGKSTYIMKDHLPARRYFNGSFGYQILKSTKLNFYVSNIFDKIYRDPYCGGFDYCVDDPVGREISAEVVFKF